jgi:hypothetical protein
MECPRYLEEKAAQSEDPEFLRHLSTCGGCQRDVEEMDEIRALYRSASVERYPGPVPGVGRRTPVGWISGAAAVTMIGLLIYALFAPGKPPEDRNAAAPGPYARMALEPWRADRGIDRAFEDCWRRLDLLERNR